MPSETSLLILGAGPFGLALAAFARHLGIDHLVVGRPMDFWKTHMPAGMILRSACDWHLDPLEQHTIESFLESEGLTPADVEPLPLSRYLDYASWFQEKKQIATIPVLIQRLDWFPERAARFQATLEDGRMLTARHVVIAPGCRHFANRLPELLQKLPEGSFTHTCDLVDFASLKEKRCLIIGGRQSAFEWAALLNEAGARSVHLSCRHDAPAFAAADWKWVTPLVDGMVENPGWFRRLAPEEKEAVTRRLWAEGRMKVEPWLESRVRKATLRPGTEIVSCRPRPGHLEVTLSSEEQIDVDHILLATGYKADVAKLPFLNQGNLLDTLATRNGYPVLNESFQTSIPGLFATGFLATQDFGPFFAFTVSVRTSAKVIGRAVRNLESGPATRDFS